LYAGNAISKVKSKDAVKLITVRTTAFPAASAAGGSAGKEDIAAVSQDKSQYNGAELTKVSTMACGTPAAFCSFRFLSIALIDLSLGGNLLFFVWSGWQGREYSTRVYFPFLSPAFPCRATARTSPARAWL
jgi:hypothetical protein